MAAPTRITVSGGRAYVPRADDAVSNAPAGEYVDAQSFGAAVTALQDAHGGLRSAENQFAAMRKSQKAGHFPEVHNNPEVFGEEADAAAKALADLGLPTSPVPANPDSAAFTSGVPGRGEDQPPVGATAAATPSAHAGDGGPPPRDAAPTGGEAWPWAASADSPDRCDAGTIDYRCVLVTGHKGSHRSGPITWGGDNPIPADEVRGILRDGGRS